MTEVPYVRQPADFSTPVRYAYGPDSFRQPGDLNWDAAELNWFSANLRVAAALAERGYDLRLVLGDGGHDTNHCGAILPDALRWLWQRERE